MSQQNNVAIVSVQMVGLMAALGREQPKALARWHFRSSSLSRLSPFGYHQTTMRQKQKSGCGRIRDHSVIVDRTAGEASTISIQHRLFVTLIKSVYFSRQFAGI
jgi:hypothetical protein